MRAEERFSVKNGYEFFSVQWLIKSVIVRLPLRQNVMRHFHSMRSGHMTLCTVTPGGAYMRNKSVSVARRKPSMDMSENPFSPINIKD